MADINRLKVIQGDLTHQVVDAIVNPSQKDPLIKPTGLSWRIHQAAGAELTEECNQLTIPEVSKTVITKGYNLAAKWIIHTVSPIWQNGSHREDYLLAKCYKNCFALVEKYNIKTIAFPPIGSGFEKFHFPSSIAINVAIKECDFFLNSQTFLEQIIIVCSDDVIFSSCCNGLKNLAFYKK